MNVFWLNLCDFIAENIDESFVLLWKNVLFVGLHDLICMINLIIIMAKFHNYKCKCIGKKQ